MAASVIKLYQHYNFGGVMQEYTGAVSSLVSTGFNDTVSSIVVEKGVWALFEDINFKGNVLVYGEGERVNVPSSFNDKLSSLMPLYTYPNEKPSMNIYEHGDFSGKSTNLDFDMPDLRQIGFNDIISSVQVNGGIWVGYRDVNFSGKQYVFTKGSWNMTSSFCNFQNDAISSFKVYTTKF